jgi:hypothetical protein
MQHSQASPPSVLVIIALRRFAILAARGFHPAPNALEGCLLVVKIAAITLNPALGAWFEIERASKGARREGATGHDEGRAR